MGSRTHHSRQYEILGESDQLSKGTPRLSPAIGLSETVLLRAFRKVDVRPRTATTAQSRRPNLQGRLVVRIQEVQQAAVSLFAARGFAATGIREIGRKLDLNSATLYHYTGSKEDLLVGIMRLALENLSTMGQRAMTRSDRPVEQLGYLVSSHVGLAALNPLTSRVIDHELRALSPHNQDALLILRDDYETLWADVFNRGLTDGDFGIDTDTKVARLALLEMCNGVANWFHADGPLTIVEIQERFVTLAGKMVGVEGLSEQLSEGQVRPVKLDVEPVK